MWDNRNHNKTSYENVPVQNSAFNKVKQKRATIEWCMWAIGEMI